MFIFVIFQEQALEKTCYGEAKPYLKLNVYFFAK